MESMNDVRSQSPEGESSLCKADGLRLEAQRRTAGLNPPKGNPASASGARPPERPRRRSGLNPPKGNPASASVVLWSGRYDANRSQSPEGESSLCK